MRTWPFQKPVPLSVGETAGQTADRHHGVRGCTPASLQEPQAPRQSGGPPPRPGSRPRGQSGEPAPLPAGRPGAAGDPVSLSLPCSHEVGGHSAQARHDVPELWASAVQAHEVSAGRAGRERPGPGLCRGGGREPALRFRGTRSVCPQRCSGCTTGDDSRVLPVTAERAPSQPPPRFPPSALMTQPRPDGSPLPGGVPVVSREPECGHRSAPRKEATLTPTHLTGRQGFPRKGPAGVILGFVAIWPVSQLLGSARPPRKRPDGMPVAGPAGLYEACAWAETPTVVYPVLEKIKTAIRIGTKALGGHGTVWRRWGRHLRKPGRPRESQEGRAVVESTLVDGQKVCDLGLGSHTWPPPPVSPKGGPVCSGKREHSLSGHLLQVCPLFGFCVLSCRS